MDDDKMIDNILKIFSEAEDVKKGESKVIKCPLCNSNLNISKSGYNGHIWAVCEKENCIKIMQ